MWPWEDISSSLLWCDGAFGCSSTRWGTTQRCSTVWLDVPYWKAARHLQGYVRIELDPRVPLQRPTLLQKRWHSAQNTLKQLTLQKKYTSVTFWAEQNFFLSYLWHFYDDNCDKTGIIIDVVGSYFYDKKLWHKMGFSSWAGRRSSWMTFFGPSMTKKTW